MANQEHLNILKQGIFAWDKWRLTNADIKPDLSGADLIKADLRGMPLSGVALSGADLSWADLTGADLTKADLYGARLCGANLSEAYLSEAFLYEAHLSWANLRRADLTGADLTRTDLTRADLNGADLTRASLINTKLHGVDLAHCHIYGVSAWDIQGQPEKQTDLVITPNNVAKITVDDLETAQFIYLILNNEKIRSVIDTITSRAVLILGRFTEDRKAVLDALRDELRSHGLAPILFDFEKPTSRNLTETVSTLAHMVRFVIADITDAKSIPLELQKIVPSLPGLPVQPIILESQYEFAMFRDLMDYPWMLQVHRYASAETLLAELDQAVIAPATEKAKEIAERRKLIDQQLAKPTGK